MRTLVDIPESSLEALNTMARSRSVSRAELVRQAIAEYVEVNSPSTNSASSKSSMDDAFGAWGEDFEDGLVYQDRLRSEWER